MVREHDQEWDLRQDGLFLVRESGCTRIACFQGYDAPNISWIDQRRALRKHERLGVPHQHRTTRPSVRPLGVKTNDLTIMKEETFGPVIAAMPVDSFEQAIAYANDSDFGLSAYLFTRDNRLIMRAVNELHFGEIYMNRPSGESPHGFHTGYRRSGIGGEDGQHGVEGYMRKKTMYNNYA